ncbi:hypothetical protein V6N11_034111 [Hibiscus sabdariffa]|uniref:FBD domain-containing protein n=1 Tax=Hibiscus sabdariffa TaxID=183260 RepID=A0ABR2S2D4_9ROSI
MAQSLHHVAYCATFHQHDAGEIETGIPIFFKCSLLEVRLFATLDIVIDLPSLVYLKYLGLRANNYSMGNMPSLVTTDINISFRNIVREIIYHGQCLVELFERHGNVKSFCLSIYPEALPILSHKRFAAFQNLLHLEILDRMNTWKGNGLFEFLEFSPNLQTLVTCKVSNELKEFNVLDVDDKSSLFEMVTYILNNAIVLNKLTISTSQDLKLEVKFKITQRFFSIPRCSNKCRVWLLTSFILFA